MNLKPTFILCLFLLPGALDCGAQSDLSSKDSNDLRIEIVDPLQKADSIENNKLLEAIEVFPDTSCNKTLEEVLAELA